MRVGVIGAGIGGLTFAAAMRRLAPDVELAMFEADASPTARPQGYAIGLKAGGGVDVLRELGLLDAVLAGDAVRVGSFTFTDHHGRVLMTLPARADGEHATYRVQRSQLRRVLADAAGAAASATIAFGRRLASIAPDDVGVTLSFDDGSVERVDLLVAADGVDSVVRRHLIGDERHVLGLAAISGDAHPATNDPLLDGGYVMSLGPSGDSLFAYPQPGGTVHFSYTAHVADPAALAARSPDELVDVLRSATSGWLPLAGTLVESVVAGSIGVRRYDDREPLQDVRHGRTWMLGDAAHPTAPFQGQGANLAMADALTLATWVGLLARDPVAAEAGAPAVAAEIASRGRKAVMESRRAAEQFHVRSAFRRTMRNAGMRVANVFIAAGNRSTRVGSEAAR